MQKTNKAMRFASVLLVLTILTTCIISGTFAKYVTSGTGTDSARVAKFGVVVTANGTTFNTEYEADDSSYTLGTNTVESSTTDNVVAPGTEGEMVSMELSGTPEVATRVTYEGNFDINDNWEVGTDFYCPLVITVNGADIDGATFTSKADFVDAVNEAIDATTADYEPNTDLSTVGSDALTISWHWPFDVSAENDVKDTALGDAAAAGNAATVSVEVETTITQID